MVAARSDADGKDLPHLPAYCARVKLLGGVQSRLGEARPMQHAVIGYEGCLQPLRRADNAAGAGRIAACLDVRAGADLLVHCF